MVRLLYPTAADSNRLDSFLRRCVKQGFWSPSDMPSICAITADIEDTLFNKILRCDYHILQSYLSDRPEILYNLRKRQYNKTVIHKAVDRNDRDFLVRNLYENLLTESLAQPSMYFYVFMFYALRCYMLYCSYF